MGDDTVEGWMKITRLDYERTIVGLRSIQNLISDFLERGERQFHKNMKQVSPGIWIHEDFKDLGEAVVYLRKLTV